MQLKLYFFKILNSKKEENFCHFDDEKFIRPVLDKKNGLEHHKNTIEALAIRGSNADFGFDPYEFPESYNLGLTSSDFYIAYHIYFKYRNSLPNLKYLFIYLSPASIGFNLISTKEKYRSVTYEYFFDIPCRDNWEKNVRVEQKIINMCIKLEKNSTSPVGIYKGYEQKVETPDNIPASIRAETHLRENKRDPDQIYWLKKLVRIADLNDVTTFMVITPARLDYKSELPRSEEIYSKVYDEFCRSKIFNFYNSNLFDDSDMYDTDHLNSKGAQKLTKLLYKKILDLEK